MPSLIDVVIILIFTFMGIKYLKTKKFEDKKGIYTEESKEKAAIICGVMCLVAAAADAVIAILKFKGIIATSTESGWFMYMLPVLLLLAFIIIVFIFIYAVVLKKK